MEENKLIVNSSINNLLNEIRNNLDIVDIIFKSMKGV